MSSNQNQEATKLATKHYWQQIKRDWRLSVPAILLPGIGSTLVFYVPTLIVAKVLARFSQSGSVTFADMLPYLGLFAGLWTLGEIFWRIALYLLIRVEIRGSRRLYNSAMDYMLAKDLAFFHDNFSGSLTKKILGYARNYENFVDTLAFAVSSNFLPLFFVVYVLWSYSPWLVLVLVGLMALAIAMLLPLIHRRKKLVDLREAASNKVSGFVSDTVSNMAAVRAFGREEFEAQSHKNNVEDYLQKAQKSWDYHNSRIDLVTSPLYVLINVVGLAVAIMVSHGNTHTLQTVFVTFSYYTTLTRVMWEFNRIYRSIETYVSDAAQFTELLLVPPKISDPRRPEPFSPESSAVEFRNVRYRYSDNDGDLHLFDGLNLYIKSGEKIGLVGHSGGGKTTVTKLLLRFMDVDDGEILVGGQNITHIKQTDLRSYIGYVPQDPAMFHRSLEENIQYGRLDSNPDEVKKAAKLSHAAEFIEKLPAKYETLVGERGVKLSGGQRQRVAIARAMLKDAPVLVLDEATSALDSESEKLIQDALWKLMEGRTAIVIAHRLSTIQKMDRIVVLEEGKIVEEGTHKELLTNPPAGGGVYAGLWAHQSGGFLEE